MDEEFLTLAGTIVPAEALTLPRTRGLADLLNSRALPFARLIECLVVTSGPDGKIVETVIFEVDVERPQSPAHPIRHTERLAATVEQADRRAPEVFALRADFPRVPHLNLNPFELPRSLCLYDQPWSDVSLRWTPAAFIERVRYWLAATARGSLHDRDQPLEPLLLSDGIRLILPADIKEDLVSNTPIRLDVCLANADEECRTLRAERQQTGRDRRALKYVATTFAAQPQPHGLIRRSPKNLLDLSEFLKHGGIDLIAALRERLGEWDHTGLLDFRLVMIVALPLARVPGAEAESWDFWAFGTTRTIREIGVAIGSWGTHDGTVGILLSTDSIANAESIGIDVLSPSMDFSRSAAAAANGVAPVATKVVAIGAGALGSQLITTLGRSGFGEWTVVDDDDCLPHNLARHSLYRSDVGGSKARGVARQLNQLWSGLGVPIEADVLDPAEQGEMLRAALSSAEVLLDISAAVPVARHLALDVESAGRRVSVFLNPLGTDLVVLAEDRERKTSLDALELQYYRECASIHQLDGHLSENRGRMRYGRSCRDISTTLPTHLVNMLAAVAAQAVRNALSADSASIGVWRVDPQSLAVTSIPIAPSRASRVRLGSWSLVIDEGLERKLSGLRSRKLPNETGGVLIGHYDLKREIVYVVDTIASPPDSQEWPVLYIRGSEGLPAAVEEFTRRSGGQLEYVGEWHSHPDGNSTLPSEEDGGVFSWLIHHMSAANLPALMAIVGQDGESRWYLGNIEPKNAWCASSGGRQVDDSSDA